MGTLLFDCDSPTRCIIKSRAQSCGGGGRCFQACDWSVAANTVLSLIVTSNWLDPAELAG